MPDAAHRCLAYDHASWRGVRANLRADIERFLATARDPATRAGGAKRRVSALLRPELQCLLAYRLAHYCQLKGLPRLARAIARLNTLVHKVNITPQSCIGPGCRLPHPPGVIFHGRAGRNLTLFSLAVCCGDGTLDGAPELGPALGDEVLIGAHAVVLGPIRIGDRAIVPLSVRVACDVPPGVLVVSRSLHRHVRRRGAATGP